MYFVFNRIVRRTIVQLMKSTMPILKNSIKTRTEGIWIKILNLNLSNYNSNDYYNAYYTQKNNS